MIKGLLGINFGVKDLDSAMAKFETVLGVKPQISRPEDFNFPGLKGVSFSLGGVNFGLVSSDNENTVVGKFLKTRGEGVLLVSLESDDIEKDVEKLRKEGFQFTLEKIGQGGFGKVNFIHPKSMHGVQIELIQPSEDLQNRRKE
jgi:methylmalonyl-CoA/ethylmalonyl-CoA epimerase